ncbi:MAG: thymidine kinase [Bacilli bacterium]|nr:thymidine kinase [Bacilli bacterium]
MAKLYFRYGAMNCGKTTNLLQVAHNYEEREMKVILIKAAIDTKGGSKITSRLGAAREVDILLNVEDSVLNYYHDFIANNINCILVDEAQFLTKKQVNELWKISKLADIPVICYGLRSDFKTNAFPGSMRLMELADELDELITICRCGKRAKFNARIENGRFVSKGDQVAIDGENSVSYEAICGKCYLEKVLNEKL